MWYFGFAFSAAMLPEGDVTVSKSDVSVETVKALLVGGNVVSCLNPSHTATIEAAKARFGLEVSIPDNPPRVSLKSGDTIVLMQVRGLPRLTDRHEYTEEEVSKASFSFMTISVQ